MGFLGGLTELLGGFAAKNQIDKDGFDWREKRAAEQFQRDRDVELARQADEDRAVGQIADVLASQEGEPDTSSIPQEVLGGVNKWRVQQALGKLPERRSRIEAAKAEAQYGRELLKGAQREREIELRGDEAEALLRARTALEAGEQPSPRDKFLAEQAAKRTGMTIDAALERARISGGTLRPQLRQTTDEQGNAIWDWIRPGESRPVAPTATIRDTTGMAQQITDSLAQMRDAAEKGVSFGPIRGRLSKIWQAAYPSGNEALFDTAARQLVDVVYTKSGKQINEQEMQILRGLIPDRAKGDIEGQIDRFERYAEGLLRRYPGHRAAPGSSSGGLTPAKRRYTIIQE
jgi:hypothetical protein